MNIVWWRNLEQSWGALRFVQMEFLMLLLLDFDVLSTAVTQLQTFYLIYNTGFSTGL